MPFAPAPYALASAPTPVLRRRSEGLRIAGIALIPVGSLTLFVGTLLTVGSTFGDTDRSDAAATRRRTTSGLVGLTAMGLGALTLTGGLIMRAVGGKKIPVVATGAPALAPARPSAVEPQLGLGTAGVTVRFRPRGRWPSRARRHCERRFVSTALAICSSVSIRSWRTVCVSRHLGHGHAECAVVRRAPVRAHQITAPWIESTVTMLNFGGAHSPGVEATFPSGSPTSVDLTSLGQTWVRGSVENDGILLERDAGTTVFASSEYLASTRPRMDGLLVERSSSRRQSPAPRLTAFS